MKEMKSLHIREQILSISRKAESLGYDSLNVNDYICLASLFSWPPPLRA